MRTLTYKGPYPALMVGDPKEPGKYYRANRGEPAAFPDHVAEEQLRLYPDNWSGAAAKRKEEKE